MKTSMMVALLVIHTTYSFASSADFGRIKQLAKIKRTCERNIQRPKILADRMAFCECIRRNHGLASKTSELPLIERIYAKKVQSAEDATVNESVVADFDADLALKCLDNASYRVPDSVILKN